MLFRLFLVMVISNGLGYAFAQSCCTSGVPLEASAGWVSVEHKQLAVSYILDINNINSLRDGELKLQDQTRQRQTNTHLLNLGYGLSPKLSAELLFSYVYKHRTNFRNNTISQKEVSNGLGDVFAMFRYNILESSSHSLQLGFGVKVPTGVVDRTDINNLYYSIDMQPGTGSLDKLFLTRLKGSFGQNKIYYSSSVFFRFNGENIKSVINQSFQVGKMVELAQSFSKSITIGRTIIDSSIGIKGRWSQHDEINNQLISNTGGSWLFTSLDEAINISTSTSIRINFEVPVRSRINGEQLVSSIRTSLAFSHKFNLDKTLW